MFVLEFLCKKNEILKKIWLVSGLHRAGRRLDLPICLSSDASVSRIHFEVRVDENFPQRIFITDLEAKFQTFVEGIPLKSNREEELTVGQTITVGNGYTRFRVANENIIALSSRVRQTLEKSALKVDLSKVGGKLLNDFSTECTHLITGDTADFTTKVVCALVIGATIVTARWLQAIVNRSDVSQPIPPAQEFLPCTKEHKNTTFLPDTRRKTVLSNYYILFSIPGANDLEMLVELAGGTPIKLYNLQLEDVSSALFEDSGREAVVLKAGVDMVTIPQKEKLRKLQEMGIHFTDLSDLVSAIVTISPLETQPGDCADAFYQLEDGNLKGNLLQPESASSELKLADCDSACLISTSLRSIQMDSLTRPPDKFPSQVYTFTAMQSEGKSKQKSKSSKLMQTTGNANSVRQSDPLSDSNGWMTAGVHVKKSNVIETKKEAANENAQSLLLEHVERFIKEEEEFRNLPEAITVYVPELLLSEEQRALSAMRRKQKYSVSHTSTVLPNFKRFKKGKLARCAPMYRVKDMVIVSTADFEITREGLNEQIQMEKEERRAEDIWKDVPSKRTASMAASGGRRRLLGML